MSNVLAIILIVEIAMVFVPTTIMSVFTALIARAHSLSIQSLNTSVENLLTVDELHGSAIDALILRVEKLESLANNEFVDDGEMDPDDNSYTLTQESRATNSSGVPIQRRNRTDDLPGE